MVEVTVVIPARDAAGTLPACLEGLAAQVGAPPYDVVVVDDGSSDGTGRIAERHSLRPTVVPGPGRGSYAARNAGAAAARGIVLAFTDADCMPSPTWLAAGLATLTDSNRPFDLVGGGIGWVEQAPTVVARYDRALYLQQRQFVAEQRFAATANLFVRRAAFERLGGFDPGLRSGGDVEFSGRAARAGYRLGFAAAAVVLHRPRTGYGELWRLHRRLGAGWAALAKRGLRPVWWREPALRMPTLGMAVNAIAADGEPLRRRQIIAAHAVVRTARVVGRLTGR